MKDMTIWDTVQGQDQATTVAGGSTTYLDLTTTTIKRSVVLYRLWLPTGHQQSLANYGKLQQSFCNYDVISV